MPTITDMIEYLVDFLIGLLFLIGFLILIYPDKSLKLLNCIS